MRGTLAIAKRELRGLFVSPMAYAILATWLLLCGGSFGMMADFYSTNPSTGGSDTPLTSFFGGTLLFFVPPLVFVPVLTMRLVAGERSAGSLEALLTSPVHERAIIFGKYLAVLGFWVALWAPTLLYVWITSRYGDVDMGSVASSYLGVFGVGAFYLAIGLFMSTVSPNQIVAATLTFLVLGMLFGLGIAQYVAVEGTKELLAYVSVWSHMQDFSKGVIDSRALMFDFSVAALALFLSIRALEWRRLRS